MSLILYLIVLMVCINWFIKTLKSAQNQIIIKPILGFLALIVVAFLISIFTQGEYMDGIIHLIGAGGAASVFWVVTTVLIIKENWSRKTKNNIAFHLLQNMLLLLIPVVIWALISNASFKIGG